MNKSQAIADLSIQLSQITTADNALALIRRALRVTGLTNVNTLTDSDMTSLLQALAAEGGAIQELAEQIAVGGSGTGTGPKAA